MEKNLPVATALRTIIDSESRDPSAMETEVLWTTVGLLCPHPSYVHGGSMGEVCSVCGLMPPDADVLPADSADLDLAADLVRESHPDLALRLAERAAIILEVEKA